MFIIILLYSVAWPGPDKGSHRHVVPPMVWILGSAQLCRSGEVPKVNPGKYFNDQDSDLIKG